MQAKTNFTGRKWMWTGLGVMLALAAAPPTAGAEEAAPKVSMRISPKGEVVAQVKLSASSKVVREVLASAERWHKLAPTTVSAKATRDGSCEKVKLSVRGLVEPFQLETRRCPTAKGWLETLVNSSDFSEYRNEWELEDLGAEGSRVTFKTRTIPKVVVPESLLQMETKRILNRVMKNLQSEFGEG